ncbi:MAG: glycosyltransferase family 2 protein [bacterium]|nr:glycosyltransferase family 2 protein [bacterium]
MKLSICIPSYNMKALLKECLLSIYRFKPKDTFEIIVGDDNSTDETAKMVKEDFPDVVFIKHSIKQGTTKNSNHLFRKAKGEFIMWLGADSVIQEGTFDRMLNFMREHPETGIVGPKLLNPDGTIQYNGRKFPTVFKIAKATLCNKICKNYNFVYEKWRNYDKTEEVDEVAAEGLLFRQSLLNKIGYFDESLVLFYQEIEWCFRAKRAGWKVYYLPEAKIKHYWSNPSASTSEKIFQIHSDEFYFFSKHFPRLQIFLLKITISIKVYLQIIWFLIKWDVSQNKLPYDKWNLQFKLLKLIANAPKNNI